MPVRDRLSLVMESVTGAAQATTFLSRAQQGPVRLVMSAWQLAGVELYDTECSAHTLRRGGPPGNDEEPALAVTYGLKGVGVHNQAGHELAARPSRVWATDLSAPYEHRINDTRTLTVKVRHEGLGVPMDVVRSALAHLNESPLAPLFAEHVRELRRVVGHVDDATRSSLGTATVSLVRALVGSIASDTRAGREMLEDVRLLRVKAFVRAHLGDPTLSVHSIAAAHHVSDRYLYKLCAAAGLRLGQWIMEERLSRAADQLSRGSMSRLSISEIAHRSGFTSAAHFSTRFRAAYGMSPREWRALNLSSTPPPAWS